MALIIDVETTGLPQRQKNSLFGQLPLHENLELYNSARVVQVSMMLCNELFEEIEFIDFIVKTDGYTIGNSQFHGITDEISATEGVPFSQIADILLHTTQYLICLSLKVNYFVWVCIQLSMNSIQNKFYVQ